MAARADGSWSVSLDLPAGEITYKYFIDGQWPASMESGRDGGPVDAGAEGYVDDGFGGRNAIRRVGGGAAAMWDLGRRRAHWIDRDTVVWKVRRGGTLLYRLHASPRGGLWADSTGVRGGDSVRLDLDPLGLSDAEKARFPHLAGYTVLRLGADEVEKVPQWLRGEVAVSVSEGTRLLDATGLQIPGVLDDLYAYDGPLGLAWEEGRPRFHLWAPTATGVTLLVYGTSTAAEPSERIPMTHDAGVWSAIGASAHRDRFYLYEVEVYVPTTGRVETHRVTDPYSRSLSINSRRSQIVDLQDVSLKPEGWDTRDKPPLAAPEDAVVYELHIRDFSAMDALVPEVYRGTYLAFAVDGHGTRHLKGLAEAGLTHVHLLPAFDIATVEEDRALQKTPGRLVDLAPDSPDQQAAVGRVRADDAYNWGYDPYHFGVPEGSYSTEPDGSRRIYEFRTLVQALSDLGLRTVMDVVYNHTHASGQDPRSVFDRIVPGYYHRLDEDGFVETSTCCQNTASEHAMMERFMIDDLVHWAVDYKVDGFRFDLMGHHMKRNMERIRDRLHALTLEEDGVDGASILLYGEGWDFGEVQGGQRGINATQAALAGTGIGTFNDRIRDALRGGSPFTDRRERGVASGLFTVPGGYGGGSRAQLEGLLDRVRTGIAGNLLGYTFNDGDQGRAFGGYTRDPQESINYASAHDNETLYDKLVYAVPEVSMDTRVRMQALAVGVVILAQGTPFLHAGSEILRSKSLDADSYDSGDWFNRLDFSLGRSTFGSGLPPAWKNEDRWGLIGPLLAREDLAPNAAARRTALGIVQDLLRVRRGSPLFRLRGAKDVQDRLRFHNRGEAADAGLIVFTLNDDGPALSDLDPERLRVAVLVNASAETRVYGDPRWGRFGFRLHAGQATGSDPVVQEAAFDGTTGTFTVPAWTVAVFEEPQVP